MEGATKKSEYDLNSAITFLLVGLGIGSVLSILFNPKQRERARGNQSVGACQGCDHEGKQRSE